MDSHQSVETGVLSETDFIPPVNNEVFRTYLHDLRSLQLSLGRKKLSQKLNPSEIAQTEFLSSRLNRLFEDEYLAYMEWLQARHSLIAESRLMFQGLIEEAKLERILTMLGERQDHGVSLLLAQQISACEAPEELAALNWLSGKIAEAAVQYSQAYEHYRQALELKENSSVYLEAAGNGAYNLARYETAIGFYEKARVLQQPASGEESEAVADTVLAMATAWQAFGELEEAEKHYLEAVRILQRCLGENHPRVSDALCRLGRMYQQGGSFKTALAHFEQALQRITESRGESHPQRAACHQCIGRVLFAMSKDRDAVEHLEQAMEIDIAEHGRDHPLIASHSRKLGNIWLELGDFSRAENHYRQAMEIDIRMFGPGHHHVSHSQYRLGTIFHARGNFREAVALYEQALQTNLNTYGAEHERSVNVSWSLGEACLDLKDNKRAAELLQQALDGAEICFGAAPQVREIQALLNRARK